MKSLSRHISLALLLGTIAVAAPVQAQESFKAGFVNTDRIFREANTAKAAQAKLEQEFARREKELLELGNTLKTAGEKFEREAPTMAESQRNTRQRQLVDQDRDFQRKRREFQEDLNVRKNEELARFSSVPTRWSSRLPKLRSTTSSCRKPSISTPARHH